MKRHWTTEELQTYWKLLPTEKKLVKQRGGRHAQLGFAILLKFFQNEGRFPRHRNLEHFFCFGKQRLLLADFQTPDLQHEESWWLLAHLAYLQLWVARSLAADHPRPWEHSHSTAQTQPLSPTRVQRDFERIIRQIGTAASTPKRRGYSPGRRKGTLLTHRPRLQVVFKGST